MPRDSDATTVGFERLVDHLRSRRPGDTVGIYLYGSAVAGGLRPDSDIDLLVLARRSLSTTERESLTRLLLSTSGWRGHRTPFPEAGDRRPIELTILVVGEDHPWVAQPHYDYQYGEWLRADISAGHMLRPADESDILLLVATALDCHRVLYGPALTEIVAPLAPETIRDAAVAVLPDLLDGLAGDERNALLTVARIVVTVETGRIVSKDAAARYIAEQLSDADRGPIELALAGYLGTADDEWSGRTAQVHDLASRLAARARRGRLVQMGDVVERDDPPIEGDGILT